MEKLGVKNCQFARVGVVILYNVRIDLFPVPTDPSSGNRANRYRKELKITVHLFGSVDYSPYIVGVIKTQYYEKFYDSQ